MKIKTAIYAVVILFFFNLNSGFLDFEDSIEESQYKLGLYVILWSNEDLIMVHTSFSSFPVTGSPSK